MANAAGGEMEIIKVGGDGQGCGSGRGTDDEQDIQDGFLSVNPDELKLKFSMVSVARNDPIEQAFVQMLLTVEPDLRDPEFENEPMALPVFKILSIHMLEAINFFQQ